MYQSVLKKKLAAANPALFAASQTPVSGTALTLTASPVADTQRRVLVTYGSEAAPRTLTLTGLNDTGLPVTEVINIPSGASGTIASVYDYKSLTQAMPGGGGWTAAMTLGTNTVGSTPWWLPEPYVTGIEISVALEFPDAGSTGTAVIEVTDDTLLQPMGIYGGQPATVPPPIVYAWPGLGPGAANEYTIINRNVSGVRLTVLTGTNNVQAPIRQAGVIQG